MTNLLEYLNIGDRIDYGNYEYVIHDKGRMGGDAWVTITPGHLVFAKDSSSRIKILSFGDKLPRAFGNERLFLHLHTPEDGKVRLAEFQQYDENGVYCLEPLWVLDGRKISEGELLNLVDELSLEDVQISLVTELS